MTRPWHPEAPHVRGIVALALMAAACSSPPMNVPEQEGVAPDAETGLVAPSHSGGPSTAARPLPAAELPPIAERGRSVGTHAPADDLGPRGPGVSAEAVKIGFWIVDTTGTCASLGFGDHPACEDNDEAEVRALNAWINANGGVAGRALDPVVVKSDIERAGYAAEAEAACEAFTQDHKVLAVVVPPQIGRPEFVSCLAGRSTPVIDGGFWAFDARDYRRLRGHLYKPDLPRPERWVTSLIDGLAAQGYFTNESRVGLVRYEGAPFRRVTEGVLKPRLGKYGQHLASEFVITPPQNTSSEYGTMNAQINSAILRFAEEDVNRVIFFTSLIEVQAFFLPAAEAQGFRPRYGLSSLDWPALLEGTAPPEQLRAAVGVGWMPGYDVSANNDPGGSRRATLCKEILHDAGLDAGAGRNGKCDNAFFLKAILDIAPALNVNGLRMAVEGLGRSFKPAATFASRFGRGMHDGPSKVRHFHFAEQCACFLYRGGLQALPS